MRAGKTTSQIRGATENTDILRRTACPLPDASPACVLRRSLITGPGVVLPLCTHTHQRQSKNCAYFCAPCEAPTSYAPCEAPSSMLSSRSLSIPLLLASHSCFCWSMPCSVFPLLVRRMTVVILSSSASPSATIAFSSNVCVWVGGCTSGCAGPYLLPLGRLGRPHGHDRYWPHSPSFVPLDGKEIVE